MVTTPTRILPPGVHMKRPPQQAGSPEPSPGGSTFLTSWAPAVGVSWWSLPTLPHLPESLTQTPSVPVGQGGGGYTDGASDAPLTGGPPLTRASGLLPQTYPL